MKPRLLMADDHRLVLEGLKSLLESEFELVGVVEDGRALLEASARTRPDVILLDMAMPLLNGLEAARLLRERHPDIKLIFVTMQADRTYVREAFRAGASGYVLKRSAVSELVTAIHEVLQGRYYVTPLVASTLPGPPLDLRDNPGERFGGLTGRQREVLQLLAEGKTVKEMATLLGVSPKTIEFHKANIMQELGLRTTAELTRYAVDHGLVGS